MGQDKKKDLGKDKEKESVCTVVWGVVKRHIKSISFY
jgi:hypothetical protein